MLQLSTGCYNFTSDATGNPELMGGYIENQEYIVLQDIFIKQDSSGIEGNRLILTPLSTSKKTTILGVLNKGTKVKFWRLERNKGFSHFFGHHDSVTPFVKILTGKYKGKEADISPISIFSLRDTEDEFYIYKLNKSYLKSIKSQINYNMLIGIGLFIVISLLSIFIINKKYGNT